MKTKRIDFNFDTLLPSIEAQTRQLARLQSLPDSEIDQTEMPELTDDQLNQAIRGKFYRPVKQQITARLDADVLDWLKSEGKGYQARMNAILRKEMLASVNRRRGSR